MKKNSFFSSLPFKLLVALAAGIAIGLWLNAIDGSPLCNALLNIIVTVKFIVGQFISFCVPLIVIGFIAPSITRLGKNASTMLGVALVLAYVSSIGAAFSISREPSIAIVAEQYGLDGPEGSGVMGAYVTGTVLGTVFYGILASVFAGLTIFHPYALAMAAGMGSASMMTASLAPLVERFPEMAEEIQAFASTSNTLTNADGLYMSLLIGLPFTEWLYKKLSKNHPQKDVMLSAAELDEAKKIAETEEDM